MSFMTKSQRVRASRDYVEFLFGGGLQTPARSFILTNRKPSNFKGSLKTSASRCMCLANTWTIEPAGRVVPSENVKSFTARRFIVTDNDASLVSLLTFVSNEN